MLADKLLSGEDPEVHWNRRHDKDDDEEQRDSGSPSKRSHGSSVVPGVAPHRGFVLPCLRHGPHARGFISTRSLYSLTWGLLCVMRPVAQRPPRYQRNASAFISRPPPHPFRLDSTRGEPPDGGQREEDREGGKEAKVHRVDAAPSRPACCGGVGGERVVDVALLLG